MVRSQLRELVMKCKLVEMKSPSEVAVCGGEQRSPFECVSQDQRSGTGGQRIGKLGCSVLSIVFGIAESAYGTASF